MKTKETKNKIQCRFYPKQVNLSFFYKDLKPHTLIKLYILIIAL